MNQWIVYIQAVTNYYKGYKLATHLPENIRSYEMSRARRDWECCAAIYRVEQRKKRIWQGALL